MITFLPYPDFQKSAQVLDRQRLGKQRLEAKQILEINLGVMLRDKYQCNLTRMQDETHISEEFIVKYWGENIAKVKFENHPAVRMWRTFEPALALYGMTVCTEWKSRGYVDNLMGFFDSVFGRGDKYIEMPEWFGLVKFHVSHQAKLISKDYDHYFPIFGDYAQRLYSVINLSSIPYEWCREDWKEF